MDMTDHELLEQFFEPARRMQVADDGFTDRVMSRLPRHDVRWLSRLWTVFCIVVAVVLFVVLQGWESIVHGIYTLVTTPPTQQQLLMLVVSAFVVGLLAVSEILSRERSLAL